MTQVTRRGYALTVALCATLALNLLLSGCGGTGDDFKDNPEPDCDADVQRADGGVPDAKPGTEAGSDQKVADMDPKKDGTLPPDGKVTLPDQKVPDKGTKPDTTPPPPPPPMGTLAVTVWNDTVTCAADTTGDLTVQSSWDKGAAFSNTSTITVGAEVKFVVPAGKYWVGVTLKSGCTGFTMYAGQYPDVPAKGLKEYSLHVY